MSKAELEAMFCTGGKIVASFIPVYRSISKKRGLGFVRFTVRIEREASNAIELVRGRLWWWQED